MTGKTILHYRIIEELGRGGMGVVYKAEDTRLKRTVALKFLTPLAIGSDEEKTRFIHEAQAAAALDDSNICPVHEIEEWEGQPFIVMAYVEGQSLKEKIASGPLKIDDAVNIAIQIAQGLQAAHDRGIVHRDIKPANILINEKVQARITDFGLAKLQGRTQLTKTGTTMGTPAYMSPEQARGEKVDQRTDIWSLGAMLYEMLAGQLPFRGEYEHAVVYSILNEEAEPLAKLNPEVPEELQQIVNRCLQKNPDARFSSAEEIVEELRRYQDSVRAAAMRAFDFRTFLRRLCRPRIIVPATAVLLFIFLGAVWFFNRQTKIHWAREELLPEIERLVQNNWRDFTEAYNLAEQAEQYIPNDPKLAALFSKISYPSNIKTDPPGARVYMKPYSQPESEWRYLGMSPIDSVRVPIGIFRWKIEKEGYETVLAAASTWDIDILGKKLLVPKDFMRVLDKKGTIPPGMTRIPGGPTRAGMPDDFFIDRYEVTNKQYRAFIDSGGYKKKNYWQQPFVKEDRILTWEEAMVEFVDQTSRPGPSTWFAGDYPDGQDDYPVTGISWYEAAAYAEFVGKSLPTGHHWGLARGENTSLLRWPQLGGFAVFAPFSNFRGKGTVAVGSLPGITSYGAYDMAGNVREWCWNKTAAGRLIRGGAWDDNPYRFTELAGAPPFDRSSHNGFRCALYPDADKIPKAIWGKMILGEPIDFYKEKPVSDAIFQIYKEQFSYDKTALNARVEASDESSPDWKYERVTFDAAYGKEHVIAHLFLPKNTPPPFQTVVYVPGSASLFKPSSEDITNYYEFPVFLSFLVRNGRAVLYPVYKGTFERREDALIPIYTGDNSYAYTEFLIQVVKDFKRSLDYLETRQDIDTSKIAYYGMSWGGIMAAIIPAVEERIKTTIILGGGLTGLGRPEANQINYVTRVKTPTLMLHGKYDTMFPYETTIKPMFDLLGTPGKNKVLKLYETDHIPPRVDFVKEILAWLDRYLGPMK